MALGTLHEIYSVNVAPKKVRIPLSNIFLHVFILNLIHSCTIIFIVKINS